MKFKLLILVLILLPIAFACSQQPEPINFGTDDCIHCKMTIEDQRFGAEIVTRKGKILKFDAIECMINYLKKGKIFEDEVAGFYVIDFSNPQKLIDAKKAVYLISPNLPSPMGANLSAFSSRANADSQKQISGGEIYNWEEVKEKIRK
ncbi:MAG: nitrous oxide reductase accessory protein NosL [Ignavibacteria bacterium]